MQAIIDAFYMTMELWIFLGILTAALGVEEILRAKREKLVDNPALR